MSQLGLLDTIIFHYALGSPSEERPHRAGGLQLRKDCSGMNGCGDMAGVRSRERFREELGLELISLEMGHRICLVAQEWKDDRTFQAV